MWPRGTLKKSSWTLMGLLKHPKGSLESEQHPTGQSTLEKIDISAF